MSITNCIKRLFKREPVPDVILIGHDGQLRFAVSRIIAKRRVVEQYGRLVLLCDDGTVCGSYDLKKWEAV